MAVRPLRPATDHCLGGPLPRQLANRPRPPLPAYCCFDPQEFHPRMLCGISPGFPELSPTRRQVSHVLLTRSPLYSRGCPRFLVRLACVRHAASVRSEPGSNSPVKSFNPPLGGGLTVEIDSCTQWLFGNPKPLLLINGSCYYLVFKDQMDRPETGESLL